MKSFCNPSFFMLECFYSGKDVCRVVWVSCTLTTWWFPIKLLDYLIAEKTQSYTATKAKLNDAVPRQKNDCIFQGGRDSIGNWGTEKAGRSRTRIRRVLRFNWVGLGTSSQVQGKSVSTNRGRGLGPEGHFESCRKWQGSFPFLLLSLPLFWHVLVPLLHLVSL